jgi:hypothetical protein
MQATIAVLCDSIHTSPGDANLKNKVKQPICGDPVTQTILLLLSSPVHVQLTVVGWQPLRGKDLTFPFHLMSSEQKQALKTLIEDESSQWNIYENAMIYRRPCVPESGTFTLSPLDVLSALCSSILASTAYQDRRLRVAICNILLQRVQASIPIDKHTQASLNSRLFPPPPASGLEST